MSTNNTRQRAFITAIFASSVLGAAQPAAALDFTFYFRGVEGYLTGLVDNTSDQLPTSVVLTSTPTGEGVRSYYLWTVSYPTRGFRVLNGEIVADDTGLLFRSVPQSAWPDYIGVYGGLPGANNGYGFDLALGDPGIVGTSSSPYNSSGFFFSNVANLDDGSNDVMTYKSAVAVPGPVPLLGALAALRCSRRLRKRCQAQADHPSLPISS
jgi:hypothetical protein